MLASLGRYGPYVKHGDEYRSLEAEDDVFTVSLDRALALLAAPKKARRRQSAAKTVLADLGPHPDSGAPVRVLAGRYGPYVTDGTTNASLPRGMEPPTVTLEIAVGLLAARAGAAPSSRRGARTSRKRAPSKSSKTTKTTPRRPRSPSHPFGDPDTRMIHVIGGGLAGTEAAWQAAELGASVVVHEMRPVTSTAVHRTDRLAELVCSNSFRGDKLDNAVGLLKAEMRRLGSIVMRAADAARVPAGAALAVDREGFSRLVTDAIENHPRIRLVREEVQTIPDASAASPVILATGPLTSAALSGEIARLVGREHLYFYDAISPIVLAESIDARTAFRASRWGRSLRPAPLDNAPSPGLDDGARSACMDDGSEGDYLNCPLDEAEYHAFYDALVHAESATVHDFDREKFFEGCLPIEVMAHRGIDTLRFGPMKPVGLTDPRTGRRPYAGGAASSGHTRGRSLQPRGLSDPAQVR